MMKTNTMKKTFHYILLSTCMLIVSIGCNKKNQHKISGRFIDATTKKAYQEKSLKLLDQLIAVYSAR